MALLTNDEDDHGDEQREAASRASEMDTHQQQVAEF